MITEPEEILDLDVPLAGPNAADANGNEGVQTGAGARQGLSTGARVGIGVGLGVLVLGGGAVIVATRRRKQ